VGRLLFIGAPLHPEPYHIEVVLACADGTLDLSNVLFCAALGSAIGLLIGIALIAVRRKSLGQLAEPQG
jgi:hypothetical protein